MTNPFASDFEWCSQSNLLVNCPADELHQVLGDLVGWCSPSVRMCSFPGPLDLPSQHTGTLLLSRIEEISPDQQLQLFDWITRMHSTARVVSVATKPIDRLMRGGSFLENLFYRLNVVQMDIGSARSLSRAALDGASCRA